MASTTGERGGVFSGSCMAGSLVGGLLLTPRCNRAVAGCAIGVPYGYHHLLDPALYISSVML